MGNESSRAPLAPSPSSSSSTAPSSFSFFSSRSSTRSKGIVIVKEAGGVPAEDPSQDENLKKLQEMPRFLPILRHAIGRREPVAEQRGINHRPVLQLCLRLSNHLNLCAKSVATKQANIATLIKTVETRAVSVQEKLEQRQKQMERIVLALQKVKLLNEQVMNIQLSLEELVPLAKSTNDLLEPSQRVPPLDLSHILDQTPAPSSSSSASVSSSSTPSHRPNHSSARSSPRKLPPIEEIRVVDIK